MALGLTHKGLVSGASDFGTGPNRASGVVEWHLSYAWWVMMNSVNEDYSFTWRVASARSADAILG